MFGWFYVLILKDYIIFIFNGIAIFISANKNIKVFILIYLYCLSYKSILYNFYIDTINQVNKYIYFHPLSFLT